MNNKEINIEIDKYLKDNWNQITEDIASLVKIPSTIEDGEVNNTFPSGEGPAKAMIQGLKIAKRMGFKTTNHKNIMGIADILGESSTQIGIIGHCDVVAPGPGWRFNPYELTYVDDYLIGRGVLDDKGPTIIFLHAINFWLKKNINFKYSIRFLFGTNEEMDSNDVKQFRKDYKEPKIVISPDADFPICYGEKGMLRFEVASQIINNPNILQVYAGESNNAVAGRANATVKYKQSWMDTNDSSVSHAIKICNNGQNTFEVQAKGRSTHAATPYDGIDSIAVLTKFLLEKDICNPNEKEFFQFIAKSAGKPEGKELGIDCKDKHYKELTIVPAMLRKNYDRLIATFDVRFPICTNANKITSKIKKHLPKNAELNVFKYTDPVYINPKSKLILALANAYENATNEEAHLFTIGGATYTRDFSLGTSFGPAMSWIPNPAWVGTLHGPDEGVSIKNLKIAFKIYVHAINNLMKLDLESEDFEADIMKRTEL